MIRLHVDYLRRTGATPRTIHHRRDTLTRIAGQLPTELLPATPDQLDQWQSDTARRISISSTATYTSHLRSFYRWAIDAGHIEHDPTVRLPRPRVAQRQARPIPRADFELALTCAPEPVRTWLVLGGFMGLRAAEVAAICREDITEEIVGGKRRTFLSGIGKGQKPYKLPVPVEVVPVLRAHLTNRGGPLWRNTQGRPIMARNVTDQVTAFFRGLGMPYTMHWCRHTFGTEVQQQTGDMLQTQVLMRHSSLNTTRLYVRPVTTSGMVAMDRLSTRLRPPKAPKLPAAVQLPDERRRAS